MEGDGKQCWVCLEGSGRLLRACRCRQLAVHELCLLRWIEEAEAEIAAGARGPGAGAGVACAACLAPYRIVRPTASSSGDKAAAAALAVLQLGDTAVRHLLPFAVGGAIAGALFVVCTVIGAHVVVVSVGAERTDALLFPSLAAVNSAGNTTATVITTASPNAFSDSIINNNSIAITAINAAAVWVALPLIPVALVAARLDVFDNVLPVLPFLFVSSAGAPVRIAFPPSDHVALCLLPWARAIYKEVWRLIYHFTPTAPSLSQLNLDSLSILSQQNPTDLNFNVSSSPFRNSRISRSTPPGPPKSIPRLIFGALFLPSISSMVGSLLALIPSVKNKYLPSVFLRTVIGGACFILARDICVYWGFLSKQRRGLMGGRRILEYSQ
ncbi:hypothetical protein HK100_010406 [Physocladia obscura]|uniref:RING-CH-type domain-containing protein n=1 Tax=Physocladia obscura TaxID=109957 RepID=A0AAD5T2J5_9FUNG|nr:hypothetical protein HK100_010406 [Physocladia obscura]